MSFDLIRKAFETRILAQFPSAQPGVSVRFDNTKFEQPSTQPWIYVVVVGAQQKRADIGSFRNFRDTGVVNITCMVAEGSGNAKLPQMIDALTAILVDKVILVPGAGSVTTTCGDVRDRGVINGWRTVNLIVEWRAFVRAS